MFAVILLIVGVVILTVLMRLCLVAVTVSGKSMFPILDDGDRVLIFRHTPVCKLRYGQIVVGYLPSHKSAKNMVFKEYQEQFYIKRLVGLPGDKVIIDASEIPDQLQFYVSAECNQLGQYIWHIPQGHCFVQGEAPMSGDSITWGPIPLARVFGVVFAKLSPNFHKFV